MLDHEDSPYIRCIGFLYLRYACEPQVLWKLVSPYLYDEESVRIVANQALAASTVGDFVRSLLSDLNFHGTRLPRLPVSIERDIKVKLLQAEKVEERAKRHLRDSRTMDYFKKLGSRVRALYEDEDNPITWYDAVVDRVITTDRETGRALARPKFVVTFPEYGNTETVSLGDMDMPDGGDSRRGGGGRDDRGSYRKRDRYDDDEGWRRGESSRSRYDDRGRSSRGYDDHRSSHRRGDRGNDRWEGRGYSRGGRERSRSRERDLMEEVRRREREQSTAKGKAYAARPLTTKNSMATKVRKTYHDEPAAQRVEAHHRRKDPPKEEEVPSRREKTPEELAAIAEKKRRLMAKYG